MKKIILAGALALFATGSAFAHEIEVEVTNFDTKNNIALGFSAAGIGGNEDFVAGAAIDAATAYAGSIAVDASCMCDMDVDISKVTTKNNLALGDASAGSITVRSSGGYGPM